jgi:hypothetical protein
MGFTRRTVVVVGCAVSLFGFSGCLSSDTLVDVMVENESDDTLTATLRIVRTDDATELLEDTVQLDPDGTAEYDEVVGRSTVEVTFDVEDGPTESFEWADGDDDSTTLTIRYEAGSIEFGIASGLYK